MNNTKMVIFDCDGVLIRSEPANVAYYNHLLKTFDLEEVSAAQREKVTLFHTLSTPQVIDTFFPKEIREDVLAYTATIDFCRFCHLIESEPGWLEVLPRLRENFHICVATNRGKSAGEVLETVGLKECFERVFTIGDVENPKPAPDLLLLALSEFDLSPEEAVYVGDSVLDSEAARKSGVPFVGFRYDSPQNVSNPHELEVLLNQAVI